MLHILELILGFVLIYTGMSSLGKSSGFASLGYGLLAIGGLLLVIHGILLYNVPDFFAVGI